VTSLPRLGLGLAALGRPAYINLGRDAELPAGRTVAAMRAATWQVLDEGYAAGIRWIDAARSYGHAEEFLAGWLGARGHRDVTVSSKWGYAYVGGWRTDAAVHEIKEHTLSQFLTQLAESRGLLGDRLSLYQVHSLTADSPLLCDTALQEALAETAAAGLPAGFSSSGANQAAVIRRALDLWVHGRRLFTAVQATWNPLEPSASAALRRAHDEGIRVLLKETLANGRLAVQPPRLLARMAARHGVGPDAVALAAALSQPWADTVLIGAAGVTQLRANLAAATLRLSDQDLAELAGLAIEPARYWAERAALPWT
jgi:aryl-alcohol dehydrogenase-like predicted oxidoreductase